MLRPALEPRAEKDSRRGESRLPSSGDNLRMSAHDESPPSTLSYEQAGVNYDLIDPLKVAAQRAAAATGVHLAAHGFSEVAASRGESAYVVDVGPFYLASIVECLGSKALVADEMQKLTDKFVKDVDAVVKSKEDELMAM